ncbi:hypothetical protein D3C75_594020 [compost metagenome]
MLLSSTVTFAAPSTASPRISTTARLPAVPLALALASSFWAASSVNLAVASPVSAFRVAAAAATVPVTVTVAVVCGDAVGRTVAAADVGTVVGTEVGAAVGVGAGVADAVGEAVAEGVGDAVAPGVGVAGVSGSSGVYLPCGISMTETVPDTSLATSSSG